MAGVGAGAGAAARRFDVIVYGATGFTGKLVAEYLAKTYPAGTLRWAIAARSAEKLTAVQSAIEPLAGRKVDMVLANARNPASLADLAKQTSVVVSTVGPFVRFGEPMVAACAAAGTSYIDSTGESPWVADMIAKYHAQAQETGALIVPMCGFDSIPSDVGTLFLVDHIRRNLGVGTKLVENSVVMKGAASGGTIHSAMGLMETKALRTAMGNPHLMCLPVKAGLAPESVVARTSPPKMVSWDRDLRAWRTVFAMSTVNEMCVRRSAYIAAARGNRYTDGVFQYREHMGTKSLIKAVMTMSVMFLMGLLLKIPLVRTLIKRNFPQGQGPSRKAMDDGFMHVTLVGTTDEATPRKAFVTVSGDTDPGYSLTSQMLAEAALTVALSKDECPGAAGGVFTPATGLGLPLATRLNNTGIRFAAATKSPPPRTKPVAAAAASVGKAKL